MYKKLIRMIVVLAVLVLMNGQTIKSVRADDTGDVGAHNLANEEKEISSDEKGFHYIYLEKPTLSGGEEQNIVISWGVEAEDIDKMTLLYTDDNGVDFEWESTKRNGELYSFQRIFGENESGLYQLKAVRFSVEGKEKEISLSELGIAVNFGVDQPFDAEKSSEYLELGAEDTQDTMDDGIATIDEKEITSGDVEAVVTETMQSVQLYADAKETRGASTSPVIIVLDPGHDNGHAGARANGVEEEKVTLAVAKYCKAELEKYAGVVVYMTRETAECPFPETIGQSGGNIIDIKKRVKWAADKGADAFVSFHLDSAGESAHGAHVYYSAYEYSSSAIADEGKGLAQKIQNELAGIGLYNRGIEGADYTVNVEAAKYGFPGLIIEHAFLTNVNDANNYLKTEAGMKKLGIADAAGIVSYYNLAKPVWEQNSNGWRCKINGSYLTNTWSYIKGAWYYFDSNTYMHTGWLSLNGNKYYFKPDGEMRTGWMLLNGKWYYFNSSGAMEMHWVKVDEQWYYMNDNGEMQTGWLEIDGAKYYLTSSGAAAIGWQQIGGKKYYFDKNTVMLKGVHIIDGKTYQFDETTGELMEVTNAGWKLVNGKWFYYDSNGKPVTGWKLINGKWYFMDEQGEMQTGWLFRNGKWYYLNQSGAMEMHWVEVDGKWYYMNDDGVMQTGWLEIGGTKYYLTSSGAAAIGWQEISGKKYYFDNNGVMLKGKQTIAGKTYQFDEITGELLETANAGWKLVNGKWFYYDSNGKPVTGWKLINGKWYFMDEQGEMQTGWLLRNGKWYYLNQSGAMEMHWVEVDGKWYYMNDDGAMQIGWLEINGVKYYLTSSGAAATGWHQIDGKKYYFDKNTVMLKGAQTIDGKNYQFDENTGELLETTTAGWKLVDGKWFYFESNGKPVTGWKLVNGKWYYMNAQGEMQTGWVFINEKWYYFNQSGVMQLGWNEIHGKWYFMNEQGAVQIGWNFINNQWYYFNANGAMEIHWVKVGDKWYYMDSQGIMVTDWCRIDGKWYYFDNSGVWIEQEPVEGTYSIVGESAVTVEQMVAYFNRNTKEYPSEALAKGGAPDITTFCKIYEEEAASEGIAVEVAFIQAMNETGWLQFGGSVKIEQFNFAGLGAIDGGVAGADFSTYGEEGVRMGIRAQIHHLKAYAVKEVTEQTLTNECVDPRFKYVTTGSARYVEWLGQKENPEGYGWATTTKYGLILLDMINALKEM